MALLLGNTVPDRRLRDVELVLRFIALLNNIGHYSSSMRMFLSNYQKNNKNNTAIIADSSELFKRTVDMIVAEVGSNAFKTTRTINKSVTDAIMVSIAQILKENKTPVNLKANYEKLIADAEFRKYTLSGTSTITSVTGRIDLARNYFLGLK